MRKLFIRLLPYVFMGVILVILITGIILFSYVLILGALIGLILFAARWVREKLFKPKSIISLHKPKQGRTFEHHD